MITDEIREAVRQAVRERAARRFDVWPAGVPTAAALRAGRMDDDVSVRDALGAIDAALTAAAPLIRAQCAEVARRRGEVNIDMADRHRDKDDPNRLSTSVRDARSEEADMIERAILALNEKETT